MSEWKPTAEWLHNYASGHAGFDDELAARLHACANELLKLRAVEKQRDEAVAGAEAGFTDGAYARLKQLQEAERERAESRSKLADIERQAEDASEYVLAQINRDLKGQLEAAEQHVKILNEQCEGYGSRLRSADALFERIYNQLMDGATAYQRLATCTDIEEWRKCRHDIRESACAVCNDETEATAGEGRDLCACDDRLPVETPDGTFCNHCYLRVPS